MEITINDKTKVVEIWLTRKEKIHTHIRQTLKPIYAEYKSKKYMVVVFESGERDLYDQTASLIIHNLKIKQ